MTTRWRQPLLSSLRTARSLHSSAFWRAKTLRSFLLADIGEGITECEILKWSVQPNSVVGAFDPLCEVQSDKASVEITSPFDGVVKQILVQEGQIAKVGQGLCTMEVDEEDPSCVNIGGPAVGRTGEPLDISLAATSTLGANAAPSYVPTVAGLGKELVARSRPHPLDPSRQVLTSSRLSSTLLDSHSLSTSKFSPAENTLAPPSVRRFARAKGIDSLAVIGLGSGKDGRIEIGDVEAYLRRIEGSVSVETNPPPSAAEPRVIDLGRTRWAMYQATTKSLEIPHFGYSTTLDLTPLVTALPILNAYIPRSLDPSRPVSGPVSPHSILSASFPVLPAHVEKDTSRQYRRLTILPLLIKALSRAMIEWPLFRTSLNPPAGTTAPISSASTSSSQRPTLTLRPHADISLALSTPTGLYTPTIMSVDTLSAYEIAGEIRRLSELGRRVPTGLTMKEMPMRGGTVSVSNIGAIGKGEWAAPVLVPGGGMAIVAIGHAKWVMRLPSDGTSDPQRRFEAGVSWSADHRVVEGAELAAFVECWRGWVEHPVRMAADGR